MYKILLFLHVFGVIAMLGPIYVLPALMRMRGDPPSVPILRVEQLISRYATGFLVVALVTGIGLITESPAVKGRFGDARWLHVSLVLFLVLAGLGTGFANPRLRKALKAAETGDAALVRRLLDPLDKVAGPILGVLGAVILYLMLIKPDL